MSAENGSGARLRHARKHRHLVVVEVAERFRAMDPRLPRVTDLVRAIRGHEAGEHAPGPRYRMLYARLYGVPEEELFPPTTAVPVPGQAPSAPSSSDELDALELSRRAGASDVGGGTVEMLEATVDDLAAAYPGTPPAVLLDRVRHHLSYVGPLLDARATVAERRRLLAVGGWLSLLAATCHVDLGHRSADARLRTAEQLARHADHPEILGWAMETRAWQALTAGHYREAVTLSQGAQTVAPRTGSAYIQATAQEGRAWARLGARAEARDALTRVDRLVEPMATPDRPEHHYRYDPAKRTAYTATTLSWLGDPAAEPFARDVLARVDGRGGEASRGRRAASARLDLSLALVAADRPDEAAEATLQAVTSGVLVPSNYWRAEMAIRAVERAEFPAGDLWEAYRDLCRPESSRSTRSAPS